MIEEIAMAWRQAGRHPSGPIGNDITSELPLFFNEGKFRGEAVKAKGSPVS